MVHRGLPWLVGAGVLALGGCAGTSPDAAAHSIGGTSSSPPTTRVETARRQGHAARYVGPVARSYDYADPGITMTVPSGGTGAVVPWRAAFDACFTGPVQCVTTGDAVVTMATVTGPDNAGTGAFGGEHMLERILMYVVTWEPADCRSLGSISHPAGSDCRAVDLITARPARRLPGGSHVYAFVIPDTSPVPGG